MKKLVKLLVIGSIAMTFLFNLGVVNAKAEEIPHYTNENGIEMSQAQYDKLLQVGYVEKEIASIDLEEFNEIDAMDIIRTTVQEGYLKTIRITHFDGTVEVKDEIVQKDDIPNQNKTRGFTPPSSDVTQDEKDDGSTFYPKEVSSITTDYKYMQLIVTYFYDEGTLGTFFVKMNFQWLEEPSQRLEDLITISFSDNLQIKSEYINGSQCPEFDFKCTYEEHSAEYGMDIYVPEDEIGTRIKRVEFDGDDYDNYAYYIDKGIAVMYDLPGRYLDYGTNASEMKTFWQTDFYMTLTAKFIPKYTNINAVTFAGTYQHKTTQYRVTFDSISLTPQKPYVGISLGISKEELFESVERVVFLEDLIDYQD